MKSAANSDVGVLSLSSFEPNTPAEFQAVVQTMFADMKRDGKTKLIVDLQGNGGGVILNGFDTFRQLFPQTQDVMLARQRVQPAFNSLATIISAISANVTNSTTDDTSIGLSEDHLNFRFDLDQSRAKFPNFAAKFSPTSFNGDNYTSLQQWNWEDPLLTSSETTGAGMDVTGYGARKNFTQPFPAENIVMLYDGVCASTCTLFSEMMRTQGKVKSIALGGRPSSSAIQGIGGVKGAQSLGFDRFFQLSQFFLQTQGNTSDTAALASYSDLPQNRSLDNGLNFSDHILDGNIKDGVPAQYINDPADCRMFFTPAMVVPGGSVEMWEQAANVAWRGKACVQGGISQGMVSARQAVAVVEPRPEMAQAAADSRARLKEIQMKALLYDAPVRMQGWADLHGKAIPDMRMP